ncbi:MAG: hypothetical protein ISS16_11885 [Ignavibacteria bacterium]|nr:hypothetical protein [Ignavibacteria bacterium]
MKDSKSILEQFKKLLFVFAIVYVPVIVLLVILSLQAFVSFPYFSIDPILLIEDGKPYFGFLSYIGILLWCSTATVCIYSSFILKKFNCESEWIKFLLASGLITTMMLVDDLFLFHEYIPNYIPINEKIIFSIYGIIILIFLIRFRKKIINNTKFLSLIVSFFFFGLSMIVDVFHDDTLAFHYSFEDGFKLLGIVSWFIYFTGTSFNSLTSLFKQSNLDNKN